MKKEVSKNLTEDEEEEEIKEDAEEIEKEEEEIEEIDKELKKDSLVSLSKETKEPENSVSQDSSNPTFGKVMVKLSDKYRGRFWSDPNLGWNIYKKETKLTPMRWGLFIKQAIRKGILIIVDKHPTGSVGIDTIGPKGEEFRKITEKDINDSNILVKDAIIVTKVEHKEPLTIGRVYK